MRQVITCSGDEAFKKALKLLAAEKGVTIADLVRAALDKAHGSELSQKAVFFAGVVPQKGQASTKKDKR